MSNFPAYLEVPGIPRQTRVDFFRSAPIPVDTRKSIVYGVCIDCGEKIDAVFAKTHIRCRECHRNFGQRDINGRIADPKVCKRCGDAPPVHLSGRWARLCETCAAVAKNRVLNS